MSTHTRVFSVAAERAVAELVTELIGIAGPLAFCDPTVLSRLNQAFGRVRDAAPDVYRRDPSIGGFHFEADYFASDNEAGEQLVIDSLLNEEAVAS